MKEFKSTNFPIDEEGRTYHVECKEGDFANRILTVGDVHRAKRIAKHLVDIRTVIDSKRGFYTVTGTFKGVEISIVSIGMGYPVLDMFLREVRGVTKGPLLVIRFGSCGSIGPVTAGTVCVASGGVMITKNYDHWQHQYSNGTYPTDTEPYSISSVIPADEELTAALVKQLEQKVEKVAVGVNASADSFYSSQGRTDISFGDENENLIDFVRSRVPNCETLEMESSMLLHLAQVCIYQSKKVPSHPGRIRATACAMVFFQRTTNLAIGVDQVEPLEITAGQAVLETLAMTAL
jgi:uridine phosphorylase